MDRKVDYGWFQGDCFKFGRKDSYIIVGHYEDNAIALNCVGNHFGASLDMSKTEVKALAQHLLSLSEEEKFEPATQIDLKELLTFAFAAALNKHPMDFTSEEAERCKDYIRNPAPRSTHQRVEHAIALQEVK